ncbi:iron complex transport system permease protein [Saccharomonospora amisosensis]|uniref:Iron complex transport system permease protein n=1 Tax=Saccharomonospora amisosensis TaxID=1128677 RepID=A0A7X5ZPK3_9PSEU|nr:iron ABC transporter permease [Saccharomonospora amisosensis]NIJ10556.1 iron complex transport system permease protein [Saccharomonospora amisosensis]
MSWAGARSLGRPAIGLLVALLLLTAAVLFGLAFGSRALPLPDVLHVLVRRDESDAAIIVWEQRIPRTLLGVLVGAALGVSGVLAQAITRNPLADPALLGVSAGAALAIVVGTFAFGITTLATQIVAASVGAAVVGGAVLSLAGYGRAGMAPSSLALVGLSVSAMIVAVISVLVLLDAKTLDEYRFWLVGAFAGRGTPTLTTVTPVLLAGLALTGVAVRGLDALALGDDVARGIGIRVSRTRLVAGLGVILLTSTAVAAVGPIGFVGLVVPHAARALTGPRHGWLLPYAAVLGATLLVAADVVGRVVVRPGELQVGVVTAVVGAPVVLLLVRRAKLAGAVL